MSSSASNRKKLDRWVTRLDDHSDATRDTALEMIVEVVRDEPHLRDEALRALTDVFKARPDIGHSVIWPIYQKLEEDLIASSLDLLRVIVSASGEFRTGGNFAMLLLWRLLESGAMSNTHPLIQDVRLGAAKYIASASPEDRDAAFRIVDWCEDNLEAQSLG